MKLMDIIRSTVLIIAGLAAVLMGAAGMRSRRLFTLKKYEGCTKESIAKASKAEGSLLILIALPMIALGVSEFAGVLTTPLMIGLLSAAAVFLILLYVLPRKYLKKDRQSADPVV